MQSDLTLGMLGTSCGVALCRTSNLKVIGPVVPEIEKKGAHVRTCDRKLSLAVRYCTLGIINPHTKFERNRPNRSQDTAKRTLLTLLTWHVPDGAPLPRMGQL